MSRIGAAVTIVATDGAAGRHGFTATAVCSVTDTPPTLLACLNRGSGSYARFLDNGTLGISVLARHHESVSSAFARFSAPPSDRFVQGRWGTLVSGAPILDDALVGIDCRIVSTSEVGSHIVLFAEVLAVAAGADHQPLIYFDRRYHSLDPIGDPLNRPPALSPEECFF